MNQQEYTERLSKELEGVLRLIVVELIILGAGLATIAVLI